MFIPKIPVRPFILSLALAAVVILTLIGCSSTPATPAAPAAPSSAAATSASPTPAPTPSAQELAAGALSSQAKLTSYQYGLNMVLKMSGTLKGQPQNVNITATGDGTTDLAAQKMLANLNMDLESPGQGKFSIPMTMYLVDGWQYVKISVPFAGTQWSKSKVDVKSFDSQDQNQQVLDMLKSAVKVTVTGSQVVDGTPCWALDVSPDLSILSQWIKSFQGLTDITGSQPTGIDFAKFVKNLSFKIYLAKDSGILKKSDMAATITINGADLGASSQPTDTLTMDISQTVTLTGTNQPVTITLPPEALTAQEVVAPK